MSLKSGFRIRTFPRATDLSNIKPTDAVPSLLLVARVASFRGVSYTANDERPSFHGSRPDEFISTAPATC